MTIYKSTIKLVVLTEDEPLDPDLTLTGIDYEISEGPAIGGWGIEEVEELTDPERIRQELIAIDNDGTFFDSGFDDE